MHNAEGLPFYNLHINAHCQAGRGGTAVHTKAISMHCKPRSDQPLPESKGCMTTAVVKLDALTNAIGPRSKDEHLLLRSGLAFTVPII